MTKPPKISVITPIYNVAPYLPAALDSILAQTYPNLEIILVDDASTDASTEIAKAYAERDPRIIYTHQRNTGVSGARNTGLRLATGAYITFVDPDDTIDPTLIAYLYDQLAKSGADISTTTFRRHADLTATLATEPALEQLFLEQNVTFHLWAKLYKRSLWDKITFPVGHIYEDVATVAQVFARAEKIHVSHAPLYHYRRRPGSFVTTPRASQFADLFHFAEQNLQLMEQDHPTIVPYAQKYLFTATRRTLQDLLRTNPKLPKSTTSTYLQRLRAYAPAALQVKQTPRAEKVLARLTLVNPHLTLPLLKRQARKPQSATYH